MHTLLDRRHLRADVRLSCAARLRALAAPLLLTALAACGDSPSAPGTPGITPVSGAGVADSVLSVHPLEVEVRGPDGRPARGIAVTFTAETLPSGFLRLALLNENDNQLPQLAVTSDSRGRASTRVLLGTIAGPANVTVAVPSLGMTRTVGYTVKAGSPVALTVEPRDSGLYVGASLTARGVLIDRWHNPIPAAVSYSTTSTGVSVQGATVQALALGSAVVRASSGQWTDSLRVSVVPHGEVVGFSMSFVNDSVGYVVTGLDGSGWKRVITVGVQPSVGIHPNAGWPRWSPDGTQFAYEARVGDAHRIFITGVGGGAPRRLTPDDYPATTEWSPTFSADGAWVYYTGAAAAAEENLWRARVDGSVAPQRLLLAPYAYLRGASPSPDGTQVAYMARRYDWDVYHGLYVMNVATSSYRQIAMTGFDGVEGPRWSPRGDWIAYSGGGSLHLIRPDGSGDHAVPGAGGMRGWTRDGTYLLTEMNGRQGLLNPETGAFYPIGSFIDRLGHADLR